MFSYIIAGLTVASEIPLTGLMAAGQNETEPQVSIRVGAVPDTIERAEHVGLTWQMNDGTIRFQVPGVAAFLISGGREIVVAAEAGVDSKDVSVFLAGTVFGILLHQRGLVALHASSVLVGAKAVLFCGISGAGKSTLAAALNARGYPLLSDDCCAIDFQGAGAPRVFSDGRVLKLWADAIARLDVTPGAAVRQNLQKHYVTPSRTTGSTAPIGAIYALREARPPLVAGIEKPNVVDAAHILRRNAYRALLVHKLEQRPLYLQATARMADHAGIYYLTRPLDFADMYRVIGQLEEHWALLGLASRAD